MCVCTYVRVCAYVDIHTCTGRDPRHSDIALADLLDQAPGWPLGLAVLPKVGHAVGANLGNRPKGHLKYKASIEIRDWHFTKLVYLSLAVFGR